MWHQHWERSQGEHYSRWDTSWGILCKFLEEISKNDLSRWWWHWVFNQMGNFLMMRCNDRYMLGVGPRRWSWVPYQEMMASSGKSKRWMFYQRCIRCTYQRPCWHVNCCVLVDGGGERVSLAKVENNAFDDVSIKSQIWHVYGYAMIYGW